MNEKELRIKIETVEEYYKLTKSFFEVAQNVVAGKDMSKSNLEKEYKESWALQDISM